MVDNDRSRANGESADDMANPVATFKIDWHPGGRGVAYIPVV